jgi:hypothetical protein
VDKCVVEVEDTLLLTLRRHAAARSDVSCDAFRSSDDLAYKLKCLLKGR